MFRLKRKVALDICTDQVEALICTPRHRYAEWTPETLQEYLNDLGLDYSLEEVEKINEELHSRGIVEDVRG